MKPATEQDRNLIATELADVETLRVSGADAITFLQGQVSCDMRKLNKHTALHGALCNLKGRVIADFQLIADGEDCLLQTRAGMAQPVMDTLGKYAVFSKVELAIEAGTRSFGLAGEKAVSALAPHVDAMPEQALEVAAIENGYLIRLAGPLPRFTVWHRGDELPTALAGITLQQQALGRWQALEIEAGLIHVDARLSEHYTPQLLNYDLAGVIDFKKGCYTGQEVVARMYYRGKAKQRLFLLRSDQPAGEDSQIIQAMAAGDRTGEILAYSNSGSSEGGSDKGDCVMLAVLSTEAISEAVDLRLSDNPGARVTVGELPYFKTVQT